MSKWFLQTKTLADAREKTFNRKHEEKISRTNNPNMFLYQKSLTALLKAFDIKDIDALPADLREHINNGLVLLSLGQRSFSPAIAILKEHGVHINGIHKNIKALRKAVEKDGRKLFSNGHVQVLLSLSGIKVTELRKMSVYEVCEKLTLPNDINEFVYEARMALSRNEKEKIRRAVESRREQTKLADALIENAKEVVKQNQEIFQANMRENQRRSYIAKKNQVESLLQFRMIAVAQKKMLVWRMKHAIRAALKVGNIPEVARILETMSIKLAMADKNVATANQQWWTNLQEFWNMQTAEIIPVEVLA